MTTRRRHYHIQLLIYQIIILRKMRHFVCVEKNVLFSLAYLATSSINTLTFEVTIYLKFIFRWSARFAHITGLAECG